MVPGCVRVCELLCAQMLSFVSKSLTMVESEVEGFLSVRSDSSIREVVYQSDRNFPFHFDKSVLLFSRISLMWGLGKRMENETSHSFQAPFIWRKVVPGRSVTRLPELPWASQLFIHFLTKLGEPFI